MAAIQLVDFEDIYTAIQELLKIQSTDTVTLARIKRDINIAYGDIVARKNWWWNRSITQIQTKANYTTGTLTVTEGSVNITFSSAPAISVANYKIKINGFPEIYTIATHTGASTSAALSVAFLGESSTTATFKVWKDFIELPTDCKETFIVQHQHNTQPMLPLGLADFRRLVSVNPDRAGTPIYYTTDDFNSSSQRRLRFFPSNNTSAITVDIDYIMNLEALDAAGDEPIMPIEDRDVLFYMAASHAWTRERNEAEAERYRQMGEKKLAEMASRIQDSMETPQLVPGRSYLAQKRRKKSARWSNG